MNLNSFSKETLTLSFYILYISVAALLYYLFPGNAEQPNLGIVFMFIMVPVSLAYASYQAYKHFNSSKSYFKCLLIHTLAWFSIIAYLTQIAK